MFGALNKLISRLDSEPQSQSASQQPSDTSYGFQVLRNTNQNLPLEPWFDFVVGINGHAIESPDHNLLAAEIKNCAGASCSLELWSAKGQRTHALTVPVPADGSLLGLTLQLAPLNSTQHVWHILTIPSPLSPAHQAGLLPHSDYILGSPSGILRGESAFGELVEDHLNRSLTLWVYNSEFDVVREVELIPRRGWGGEGALGAILGYGALHRLPVGLGEEVQAPGENMFDADSRPPETTYHQQDGAGFIDQPAQTVSSPPMINPTASPPPMINPKAGPPARGAAKKKGRAAAPSVGFDDMFAEGQKKSAENDYISSKKGNTAAAPPPSVKAAGAPTGAASIEEGEDVGEPGEVAIT